MSYRAKAIFPVAGMLVVFGCAVLGVVRSEGDAAA